MRDPTTKSTNNMTTYSKSADLEATFEQDEKTSKYGPVPTLQRGQGRGHYMLCFWCKAAKLVARTRGARSDFAPKFRRHPSAYAARDVTSIFERQHLQTRLSTAAVQQGEGPVPEGRYKRCHKRKHQRVMEVQLHHRKIGLGPNSPRNSSIRKPKKTRL